MSNHLHIVVTPARGPDLPRFVHRFAQRYATYRNRRRSSTGKLFEERYRSFILDNDDALATATAYVDLNPVRAGQVLRAEEHRFTTARLHLGEAPAREWAPSLWTPSAWYLGMGGDAEARARSYREWLLASRAREPAYVEEVRDIEALSSLHYAHRIRRPDGTSAT